MSKLTKNIREQMAKKLVAYRYAGEAKELVRLNRTLADRAYAHLYSKDIIAAMDVITKRFIDAFGDDTGGFRINAGGYNLRIGGDMYSRWVKFEQAKHSGYRTIGNRWSSNHSITDEVLTKEIKEFAERMEAFDGVCSTAYTEALSVLNTMTTGKKLAEAWPEAIPVIGDLIPEDQRTLPVVQVSAINAKFKLPPEKGVAVK